jgi:anti-anti-sigma factor
MPHRNELITLTGDIDLTRLDDLAGAVDQFHHSAAKHAVVDLSGVTFFGSEAAGLVARLCRLAVARGGTVTLVNAGDAAIRVIDICGPDGVVQERHFAVAPPRTTAVGLPRQRIASDDDAEVFAASV